MKFVNPEIEVRMFSVQDILTTSDPTETSTEGSTANPRAGTIAEAIGQECTGTAADQMEEACI